MIMKLNKKIESCLVLLKPDCLQRKLSGTIISMIESAGMDIVALKMMKPNEDLIGQHYQADPVWLINAGQKKIDHYREQGIIIDESPEMVGNGIRKKLIHTLAGKAIKAMIVCGPNAIQFLRKLAGSTEPLSAAFGTIRGSYSSDSYEMADAEDRTIRNLIHVSDCPKSAVREIKLWFPEYTNG